MSEPLFRNAHAALVFALNYSGQAYDRPLMNRMSDEPRASSGKGLHGLDGAAQAGMIRAEVSRLAPAHQAALVARVAPQSTPCSCRHPCCSGHRPNAEWTDAIAVLSTFSMSVLSGCISNARLRRGIVGKHFGAPVGGIGKLADACGVNRDTASQHNAKITRLLKETEGRAWHEIDQLLMGGGMIPARDAA